MCLAVLIYLGDGSNAIARNDARAATMRDSKPKGPGGNVGSFQFQRMARLRGTAVAPRRLPPPVLRNTRFTSCVKLIAAELIAQVKKSVTIDWNLRESARARIKVMVKRILNKYGYPPDLQEEAVKTVLAQAELLCAGWVD